MSPHLAWVDFHRGDIYGEDIRAFLLFLVGDDRTFPLDPVNEQHGVDRLTSIREEQIAGWIDPAHVARAGKDTAASMQNVGRVIPLTLLLKCTGNFIDQT